MDSLSSSEDETMVIPINRSMSDGDPTTWPQEDKYQEADDSIYRKKLAVMWLKQMGASEEGISWFSCLSLTGVV